MLSGLKWPDRETSTPALALGFQANYSGLDKEKTVRDNMSQPGYFGKNICGTYSSSSRDGIGERSESTATGKMNL
jgi:hypothetical protein